MPSLWDTLFSFKPKCLYYYCNLSLNCSKKLLQHCPEKQNPFCTTVHCSWSGWGDICIVREGGNQKWKPGADGKGRRETERKERGAEGVERRLWEKRKKKEIKIIKTRVGEKGSQVCCMNLAFLRENFPYNISKFYLTLFRDGAESSLEVAFFKSPKGSYWLLELTGTGSSHLCPSRGGKGEEGVAKWWTAKNQTKTKKHYFHLSIRLSGQVTKHHHKYPKSIGSSASVRAEAGKGLREKMEPFMVTCGRVCTNILDFDEKNKLICHYIRPFSLSVSKEE